MDWPASLPDLLSVALVHVGADGTALRWNRAAEMFFGADTFGVDAPDEQAPWRALALDCHARAAPESAHGIAVPTEDAPERWLDLAAAPLPDGTVLVHATDVTEHVLARLTADERAVRRDRFFSAMSHDLRTPITAIVGYSELLQDGIVGTLEPAQREMVERISQVAGHLSQLVNDILDLAKLDAGRMEFNAETVALGTLVEQAALTIRPQAASKALSLHLEMDSDAEATIHVDPHRVRHILVNLLSNAVKFTERGEVRVAARIEGTTCRIAVRDTGPGLPAGSEEIVFEEFLQIARGNKAKREREPGTGLGLAISRRLARAMGGELSAQSVPGEGATFTLDLPVAPPE